MVFFVGVNFFWPRMFLLRQIFIIYAAQNCTSMQNSERNLNIYEICHDFSASQFFMESD